jgi:hypothetical protein
MASTNLLLTLTLTFRIVRKDQIGQGSFGDVYLGELWSFDVVHGWAVDTSVIPNARVAMK